MDFQEAGCSTIVTGPDSKVEFKWSENETKSLIDLYAKYREKVGSFAIKNTKMLWKKIADELQKLNTRITPNNCMNRWRVLERNYKKFVDNQNKTGRGRKFFEYAKEMEEIFGQKKNIHPEVLLSSDTVDTSILDITFEESIDVEETTETKERTQKPKTTKSRAMKQKLSTMEKMRMDRKAFYEKRLELESRKIELLEEKNKLIRERNEIMKQKLSTYTSLL